MDTFVILLKDAFIAVVTSSLLVVVAISTFSLFPSLLEETFLLVMTSSLIILPSIEESIIVTFLYLREDLLTGSFIGISFVLSVEICSFLVLRLTRLAGTFTSVVSSGISSILLFSEGALRLEENFCSIFLFSSFS